ncbi:unnamed protein product, partial [Prorocentrum cordatum]
RGVCLCILACPLLAMAVPGGSSAAMRTASPVTALPPLGGARLLPLGALPTVRAPVAPSAAAPAEQRSVAIADAAALRLPYGRAVLAVEAPPSQPMPASKTSGLLGDPSRPSPASPGRAAVGGGGRGGGPEPRGLALEAGDLLLTAGSGHRLLTVGQAGGLLGHVSLALGRPTEIHCDSPEGRELRPILTRVGDPSVLWQVETMECTQSEQGLHRSFTLMHVDEATGKVYVIGERSMDGQRAFSLAGEPVPVELWRCPAELRSLVRGELVDEVVSEMEEDEDRNWSLATAMKAVFLSASGFSTTDKELLLEEIKGCWGSRPICTTVAIAFWQRYLCKLEGANAEMAAAEAILRWMPLKADRGLPQELRDVMADCGWQLLCLSPRSDARCPRPSRPSCEQRARVRTCVVSSGRVMTC